MPRGQVVAVRTVARRSLQQLPLVLLPHNALFCVKYPFRREMKVPERAQLPSTSNVHALANHNQNLYPTRRSLRQEFKEERAVCAYTETERYAHAQQPRVSK